MNAKLAKIVPVVITVAVLLIACIAAYHLWAYYMLAPWTRDARVRADVVQIAPDVSGLVKDVLVHDNQRVKIGDVIFVVDRPRYELAEAQAEASLENLREQLAQATREDRRNRGLGDLVSGEQREQGSSKLDQIRAAMSQAKAALDVAKLNLERTQVKATVNSYVTNFDLRPGSYATAGRATVALVDEDSIYVAAYFEENKIPRVHVGDRVRVRLMGESVSIGGHVDSIAAGIEDRERASSSGLLANINPTFNWVRLPQRIPVRIHLDHDTGGGRLIVGRTATVEVVTEQTPKGAKK
jgi:RND family efflux transporter MFP subunit